MSARRNLVRRLSEDNLGGIATLQDVTDAEQLLDAYRAQVLREAADRIDRTDLPPDDVDVFDNGARWATAELRRMVDEVAEENNTRKSESAPADVTVYRAAYEHDPFPLGLYANDAAARAHCEDQLRRDLPTVALDWIVDEEDGVAELVASVGDEEHPTGYTVTAVVAEGTYDPEADS